VRVGDIGGSVLLEPFFSEARGGRHFGGDPTCPGGQTVAGGCVMISEIEVKFELYLHLLVFDFCSSD
jgi:hypothetical protein